MRPSRSSPREGDSPYVASVHEGFPYAEAISGKGYNAFVLKYRAGQGGTVATQDMAAAVSYILENAATLGVSTSGYSLWGSSAGARMAAAIGSHGVAKYGGRAALKPSVVVMAYTGHSDHASVEPPTFVVVGEQDGIAPPAVMEQRVEALRKSGTRVEFHKYEGLGHGFGLGKGTSRRGVDLRSDSVLGDVDTHDPSDRRPVSYLNNRWATSARLRRQ